MMASSNKIFDEKHGAEENQKMHVQPTPCARKLTKKDCTCHGSIQGNGFVLHHKVPLLSLLCLHLLLLSFNQPPCRLSFDANDIISHSPIFVMFHVLAALKEKCFGALQLRKTNFLPV